MKAAGATPGQEVARNTTALPESNSSSPPAGWDSANDKCPFCRAPALKPNRRERRQHRSSVGWVMQHATWCRVYGGQQAQTTPRPNGGAA